MISLSKPELTLILYQELRSHIPEDFIYKKRHNDYIRKRVFGMDIFRVDVYKWTRSFSIVPAVFFSNIEINLLLDKLLGVPVFRQDPTFGFGIANECSHKRSQYFIEQEADIDLAIFGVIADFNEVALPWFSKIQDMKSFDTIINARDAWGKYNPGTTDCACAGLIAAHFSENHDFDNMAKAYYEFCRNAQGADLAKPILDTWEYLKKLKRGPDTTLMEFKP